MPHIYKLAVARHPYCMINSGPLSLSSPPLLLSLSLLYELVVRVLACVRVGDEVRILHHHARLQLRAPPACPAVQCRSSHGLRCGETDLHPKANRVFFPLPLLLLSLSLSLSRFLSSTSLQSYHVTPPPLLSSPLLSLCLPPLNTPSLPPHPPQPLQEREREREREKSAAECERHVDSQPLKCFLGRSLILWRRTE